MYSSCTLSDHLTSTSCTFTGSPSPSPLGSQAALQSTRFLEILDSSPIVCHVSCVLVPKCFARTLVLFSAQGLMPDTVQVTEGY